MGSAAGSQGCTLFTPALCHGNESLSGVEGAHVSPRSVETICTGSGCSAFWWNQDGDPVRAGGGQQRRSALGSHRNGCCEKPPLSGLIFSWKKNNSEQL